MFWHPKKGVYYHSYRYPNYPYIRGKSTNISVKFIVDKKILEGGFKVSENNCEIYIKNSKLNLPLYALKFKKKYQRRFISEQPDLGWLINVNYYVFIKKRKLNQEEIIKLDKILK